MANRTSHRHYLTTAERLRGHETRSPVERRGASLKGWETRRAKGATDQFTREDHAKGGAVSGARQLQTKGLAYYVAIGKKSAARRALLRTLAAGTYGFETRAMALACPRPVQLTHTVAVDEAGAALRVVCGRVELDRLASPGRVADLPTCPLCAGHDPRFPLNGTPCPFCTDGVLRALPAAWAVVLGIESTTRPCPFCKGTGARFCDYGCRRPVVAFDLVHDRFVCVSCARAVVD